ncbi:MAG: leucine--tRNA ligase [Patescibacteria group bacterium]|nr:leucine--tRNA ligase [Patescibacteria group bacterium]
MENYKPHKIEEKWQERWEKDLSFQVDEDRAEQKFYALVEFPYPSGKGLHLGHAFTCTIMDVFARKKRMEGFNVLHPMGWDAFGLPTENYAIRTGIHPRVATERNTDRFREQMKALALSYNWEREINTTDPDYYKWTQWIFIQFFKHGLAYKREMPINWCPSCKIGLANEEVVNGKCERCGEDVTRKNLSQWLLRITAYADRLADELDLVDFPESIKAAQRNWIGRTEGIVIDYPVEGSEETISCYTTRPDTNFGATFVVLAPEHPMLKNLKSQIPSSKWKEVKTYVEQAKKKFELERQELQKEKTGVFTGLYCVNRLTDEKIPIWVADFVVPTSGTGAVVGVPAHDERDYAFANKYDLNIKPVIKPQDKDWDFSEAPYVEEEKSVVINSDFLNGMCVPEAIEKVTDYIIKNGWGERSKNYHLRDWIFSRQHYWGEPIPMVYCKKCAQKGVTWWDTEDGQEFQSDLLDGDQGVVKSGLEGWFPVKDEELPIELPAVENYEPTKTGHSPLAGVEPWVETKCPVCGAKAQRETDTMPNWAGSSWYYLRYCDPSNSSKLASYHSLKYWLPVDIYLGGAEHTTLHLLYSRFWHKFLNDIGVVPYKEPYQKRRNHGVILGEDGSRMSKSRENVVNPEDVIDKLGVDTLRLYLMFMGPYDETMPWSTSGVRGCYRFLDRVWRYIAGEDYLVNEETRLELKKRLHRVIKKVGDDINAMKYNTAIAALMGFLNHVEDLGGLSSADWGVFLRLLAPFAPHVVEELWCESLGNEFSIHAQPWPKYDQDLAKKEEVTIAVQIDGKLRDTFRAPPGIEKENAVNCAKGSEKVKKYLLGKDVERVVWVQDRLLNFVIK